MSDTVTLSLEDALGNTFALEDSYKVEEIDGLGAVSPVYATRAAPAQDGATIANARRGGRVITFAYNLVSATHQATWQNRPALPAFLENIRQDVWFKVAFDDGRQFKIQVRYLGGLEMPRKASDPHRLQKGVVQLYAQRPDWHAEDTTIWVYGLGVGEGSYSFPASYPISWGGSVIDISESRTYLGTARGYLVWEITGPLTDLVIENESTGYKLDFTGHTITTGEVVTIDSRPGYKTVTSTGSTTINDLTDDSDLLNFYLAPASEVLDAINVFALSATGATSLSSIVARHNARFTAI